MRSRMSPLSIGMNARLFPNNWRPVRQDIAFASANGLTCLQVPGLERGLDADRLGDPLGVVGADLAAAGLTTVMEIIVRIDEHGRTGAGATPVDVLRANLPAITALGCAYVHWHPVPAGPMQPAARRAMEHALAVQCAAGVELAAEYGFRLGLEHNVPSIDLFATPASCAQILAAAPGLGFVCDLSHIAPADLADYLELAPRISVLHVSDTPLPALNHHLPLGEGTFDFAAFVGPLLGRGFCGPAILEIGGQAFAGGFGRDTDAALCDSRDRLQAVIDRINDG